MRLYAASAAISIHLDAFRFYDKYYDDCITQNLYTRLNLEFAFDTHIILTYVQIDICINA